MSETSRRILRLLRDRETPTEIAEIAESLDVHPNTVRFHLDTLVANGQVERSTAQHDRPGRPPQLFAAVRTMDPTGPRNYRLLAEILATAMSAEPRLRALEAGRRWGRSRAAELASPAPASETTTECASAVDALMRVMEELDFAPERREGDALPVIGLRHCPFLELANSRSDVVCPVHLGLMRGLLEAWGGAVTVDRLEAFTEPDLCAAHLAAAGAS